MFRLWRILPFFAVFFCMPVAVLPNSDLVDFPVQTDLRRRALATPFPADLPPTRQDIKHGDLGISTVQQSSAE
jgi:hypothetical protein